MTRPNPDTSDTIPMFEIPAPARRPEPKRAAARPSGTPTWVRYRPARPVKCDRCMAVHAQTGGHGPLAAQAHYSRTLDGVKELLCYQHAQTQRERDGMTRLRGRRT